MYLPTYISEYMYHIATRKEVLLYFTFHFYARYDDITFNTIFYNDDDYTII